MHISSTCNQSCPISLGFPVSYFAWICSLRDIIGAQKPFVALSEMLCEIMHRPRLHMRAHTLMVCLFFFFPLQSKRSSTEINTRTASGRRSCGVQLQEVRAQCEAHLTSSSVQWSRLLLFKIPDFQNANLLPQRIVMPELFMWDWTLNHH